MRTALLLTLLSCARTPPPPATVPPTPAPTAPGWEGVWHSPACGARTWVRVIELGPGGVLRGEDQVSPCPPGTMCAWSGIVPWSGTWTADGATATLTVTTRGSGPDAAAPPPVLGWEAGAPAEPGCPYTPRPVESP